MMFCPSTWSGDTRQRRDVQPRRQPVPTMLKIGREKPADHGLSVSMIRSCRRRSQGVHLDIDLVSKIVQCQRTTRYILLVDAGKHYFSVSKASVGHWPLDDIVRVRRSQDRIQ